jgi:hypothetical protein
MRKRSLAAFAAILFLFAIPLGALAMDQGQMGGMNKGGMEHGQMNGMQAGGMLGARSENGVKAMAHIKDVHEAMAKMGMHQTHHFMVMFTNAETGKSVGEGTVAVKIKDPSGKVSEPIMLREMNMGMGKGFGSDITLPEKGTYTFIVGSRLADGDTRQFHFEYTWK